MSVIEIKDLYKSFGKVPVLKGIDLKIEKGQAISILGPSGSGKSTLLRCMNGLERPDSGSVIFKGKEIGKEGTKEKDLDQLRSHMGMVFQHFNLFPHLSIMENITLAPVLVKKIPVEEAIETGRSLLNKVGLGDKENAYPEQLSGGQKQRAAIARALAMSPEVMLFDEPTSALDPEMIKGVLQVIEKLVREGMTTVIVTHEMGFARRVSTRIVFLDQGLLLEDASPEEFFTQTKNPRARAFLDQVIL